MASIFTYDPDPPRVSSPWSEAGAGKPAIVPSRAAGSDSKARRMQANGSAAESHLHRATSIPITGLSAEPETGPTEYKLHLLLRPRRSAQSAASAKHAAAASSAADTSLADSPPLAASAASRQHRLEQLTTQLLWRLQQSSPFHSSTASNLVLPMLPEASTELSAPQQPAKLVPGLEESKGALYEIGVADNGTFVGLTRDEMNESLNNLQAMAASLGCSMEVLRMVPLGQTQASAPNALSAGFRSTQLNLQDGLLYVAEAYIKPVLERSPLLESARASKISPEAGGHVAADMHSLSVSHVAPKEQLRVSLTGATTSGKSSLLGTLSTSTLDNGRGKSRLSLLKHRHEIASGMTSSVAQELVGYQSVSSVSNQESLPVVVNYATEDVASWNDIHAASETGRLAFLSDSAGHPRYRRTTVRGLVGWAPHWTMLCMAACDGNDAPSSNPSAGNESDLQAFAGASAHLSMAHLELCLKLQLPLIVVITKLDVTSRSTFRQMLSTLLTTLKSAGRKPLMVANDNRLVVDEDLQLIPDSDVAEAKRVIDSMGPDPFAHVPIVFTSAVKGIGIGKIHAFLRYLPITNADDASKHDARDDGADEQHPSTLFYVDEVFDLDLAKSPSTAESFASTARGFIVSGHLVRGSVSVGQELLLGPFSYSTNAPSDEPEDVPRSNRGDPFLTPRSFTDALAKAVSPSQTRALPAEQEWRRVRVISLRNLRLPVQVLQSDRVGTMGVVPVEPGSDLQLRRGMALADCQLTASHTLIVTFDMSDATSIAVGSRVVIYSATIRSAAKILTVSLDERRCIAGLASQDNETGAEGFAFGMEEDEDAANELGQKTEPCIAVTLQLDSYREFVEIGSKVLLMPGGGPGLHSGDRGTKGLAGLEGFMGRVAETYG